jgi:hypothetical protein
MDVRRLVTVVGVAAAGLGLLVASAGPAAAKGPTGLTIAYPGGGPPVDLGSNDGTTPWLGALIEDLGLWSALGDDTGAPSLVSEPPEAPVGEPFTVRWAMYSGAPEPIVITQRLYLDQDGGGLVYTEPGQPAGPYAESGTTGGWFTAPPVLSAHLASAGFDPTAAPVVAASAAGNAGDGASARDDGATRGWWVPVGLAAAAAVGATAVGAAAIAGRRGRRTRDAAPATG